MPAPALQMAPADSGQPPACRASRDGRPYEPVRRGTHGAGQTLLGGYGRRVRLTLPPPEGGVTGTRRAGCTCFGPSTQLRGRPAVQSGVTGLPELSAGRWPQLPPRRHMRQMRTPNLAGPTIRCCLKFWRYDQAYVGDHGPLESPWPPASHGPLSRMPCHGHEPESIFIVKDPAPCGGSVAYLWVVTEPQRRPSAVVIPVNAPRSN